MRNVLFIGGPPSVGKTTVAVWLARRYGFRLYSADTRTWDHRDRALRSGHPAARRWVSLTPEERWERSTPAEMLAMSLHVERGPMVIDDLRSLPESPLIVAEGTTLPAAAVSAGVVERSRAIWLLPTPEFHQHQLQERGVAGGVATLYRLLSSVIGGEAREHGVPVLEVSETTGITEVIGAVERQFREALDAGPGAAALKERRLLLREMNLAIVHQVRGYYARPWARGEAGAVRRTFVCECGEPGCVAGIDTTVGEVATGQVVAPGHVALEG